MSLSPYHSTASSLFCGEDAGEVVSSDSISDPYSFLSLPLNSPLSDETTIARLIEREAYHMPHSDYLQCCCNRSIDVVKTPSMDLKGALILSVSSSNGVSLRQLRASTIFCYVFHFWGWLLQLLSVACLSLAAKMEEPQVPLLLELQLFKPTFIFEPKMVQKMELWVMVNLNWRLHSITPFDYLNYFISKLPSSNIEPESVGRFISAASDLILRTTRDFLGFAPSTIAAAAMLCSTGQGYDIIPDNDPLSLFFHDTVNTSSNAI